MASATLPDYEQQTPNSGLFIDSNNFIQDIQQILQGGSMVVTATMAPSPVIPVGAATIPKIDNLIPWAGNFVNSSNQLIDLLSFLTSGAIQVQVVGGGGGGGGLTFYSVSTTPQAMLINSIYYTTYAGLNVMTLPASAIVGSIIRVIAGSSGNTFKIAQNSGQKIEFGAQGGAAIATTVGVGGYLQSVDPNTQIELICVVANTTWMVLSAQQNLIIN